MSNLPLPPLLERVATGKGPVLGFLKEYTKWLQGLKKHQEDCEYQQDLLKQIDKMVDSADTEKWIQELNEQARRNLSRTSVKGFTKVEGEQH